MGDSEFLGAIQSRAARIAIGPSTLRGQGDAGLADVAREFLLTVDLRRFGTGDETGFGDALEHTTQGMLEAISPLGGTWGAARKAVNIFLCECLYTSYLREEYRLHLSEEFYELPMDSITGRSLRSDVWVTRALPAWPGVKHLTPEQNRQYQAAASEAARARGTHRVHLDAFWWSQSRDGAG